MKILIFSLFTLSLASFLGVSTQLEQLFKNTELQVTIPLKKVVKNPVKALSESSKAQTNVTVEKEQNDFSDIENLNFIPVTKDETHKNKKINKAAIIRPVEIEKNNPTFEKIKFQKEIKIAPTAKLAIKTSDYELDYSKLNEQKPYKVAKLKEVAWSGHGIDLNKYKEVSSPAKAIAKSNLPKPASAKKSQAANVYGLPLARKEKLKEIDNTVDRISTEASAIEKSATDEPEELVFFDYSTPEPKSAPKVIKEIVESNPSTSADGSVAIATAAIAKMEPVVKSPSSKLAKLQQMVKQANGNKSKPSQAVPRANTGSSEAISKAVAKLVDEEKAREIKDAKASFTASECLQVEPRQSEYSYEYLVEMRSIGVTNQFRKIHNFDVKFQDNLDELERDFGEGQVLLKGKLKGELNIRRAVFNARGHYPTSIDLALEDASVEISIPSLQIDKMGEITHTLNIADVGAHLLVELDKTTEDVELGLDHNYKAKVYLDRDYNIVDRAASDYYFVLFIGVDSGNTIVQFKNIKGEILTKITHLSAGLVHYEPNFYADYSSEQLSFFEENVLSDCKSLLSVKADEVSSWAFNKKFKQENLNTLSVTKSSYPVGSRKYYKLTHLDEPIFIGRWNQENIEVPSEQYMQQVLTQFNVRGGECLVQVNLTGKPLSVKYNGLSPRGGLNLELAVLDEDGKFYNEPSDQTKRLFLLGETQGIINIEITYPGDAKQYLQTYCSENTFLVEQL